MAMATLKNASRQDESRRVERSSVSTPGQTCAPLSPMNGSHRRTTSINLKERRLTVVCLLLVVLTGSGIAGQSQFLGSVPTGVPSSTPLALSLREAIDRGLKTNLGLLLR
jgi:hypothetical protein